LSNVSATEQVQQGLVQLKESRQVLELDWEDSEQQQLRIEDLTRV
jgi:hypothetical protein